MKELLDGILNYAIENNIPDVHFMSNSYPRIRNKLGDIEELREFNLSQVGIMSREQITEILKILLGENEFYNFLETKEYDSSYTLDSMSKFRVNSYIDSNGYSIALRSIPKDIPSLTTLGLGDVVKNLAAKPKGLFLVVGPTGSGKSTNLASIIEYINSNFKKHIITIEDPIEFAFESKKSLINQRELGNHTDSFTKAIRASLREDPDVIMVGEMRDADTIKAALTLAETGHLVLSTLHTNDSVQTIDRIVDTFPSVQQAQIRMQLSQTLLGILSQRLIPKKDEEGRIATRELLIVDDAIKNLIINAKTNQIYSVLEVGQSKGMILMDKYLLALYEKDKITRETLLAYARDRDSIALMIN